MLNVSKTNTANAITIADVKTWLRLSSGTAEDTLLQTLVNAAQDAVERLTGYMLTTGTVVAVYAPFSGDEALPYAPYTSTTTITSDGADVSESYTVTGSVINGTEINELTVTYVAGYTTNLPAGLKLLLYKLVGHWYSNRGDTGEIPKDILNELSVYSRNMAL